MHSGDLSAASSTSGQPSEETSPQPDPAAFLRWRRDPRRTSEELYLADDLLDDACRHWDHVHNVKVPYDHAAATRRRKERDENPAYRRPTTDEEIEHAAEMLGKVQRYWGHTGFVPRYIRSLAGLPFFCGLESLYIKSDLAAAPEIATLPLKSLSLDDQQLTDLSFLTRLTRLESLSLDLDAPWPVLPSLAGLPRLKKVSFSQNLLTVASVERLPAVEEAKFKNPWKLPLRDLRGLPEMPNVLRLEVDGTASLEGAAARFPRVVNLIVHGPLRDLSPLAELTQLTSLEIFGGFYDDLTPLTRLPHLHRLHLNRLRPLDLTPLAEMPALHEVTVDGCPALDTELGAIRAVLPSWSDRFAARPPRPLSPLRFVAYARGLQKSPSRRLRLPPVDQLIGPADHALSKVESKWFNDRIRQALDALLGVGWGDLNDATGRPLLSFVREADCVRLEEIVELLRTLSAGAALSHDFWLIFDPKTREELADYRAERNLDEFGRPKSRQLTEQEAAESDREWAEFRRDLEKRREERDEREHQLRLREQQGLPINPQDFSPPPDEEAVYEPEEVDVLEAAERDRLRELYFQADLTEETLWVLHPESAVAERLLLRKAEEWDGEE